MKMNPVGAELFRVDRGRAEGRKDGRTNRQIDKHDETNSLVTQFCERAKCS